MANGGTSVGSGVSLTVVLQPDPEVDAEECERLSRGLRRELVELDIESITSVPAGALPKAPRRPIRSHSGRLSSR